MSKTPSRMILGLVMLIGGCQSPRFQPPTSISIPQPQPPNPPAVASNSSSVTDLEMSIYQQVNQYRQSQQLTPLKLDPRISQQARIHSQQMAAKTVPFSHQGFEGRVKTIGQGILYRTAAENVAYNQGYADPTTQAVQGWIGSQGHHKNMVGQFDLTGVGVAENAAGELYFTQIFILKR